MENINTRDLPRPQTGFTQPSLWYTTYIENSSPVPISSEFRKPESTVSKPPGRPPPPIEEGKEFRMDLRSILLNKSFGTGE